MDIETVEAIPCDAEDEFTFKSKVGTTILGFSSPSMRIEVSKVVVFNDSYEEDLSFLDKIITRLGLDLDFVSFDLYFQAEEMREYLQNACFPSVGAIFAPNSSVAERLAVFTTIPIVSLFDENVLRSSDASGVMYVKNTIDAGICIARIVAVQNPIYRQKLIGFQNNQQKTL